jgi:hypothetical protein
MDFMKRCKFAMISLSANAAATNCINPLNWGFFYAMDSGKLTKIAVKFAIIAPTANMQTIDNHSVWWQICTFAQISVNNNLYLFIC